MADQQPGDTTPAAGMPDPTRFAGSGEGEPPTADLPGRWSGAAAVPEPGGPRRSRFARVLDKLGGTRPAAADLDDRTAVPAVDPWADQDTPVWPGAYTTPAADPTLFDSAPPEPTLFETAPAATPAPSRPAGPPASTTAGPGATAGDPGTMAGGSGATAGGPGTTAGGPGATAPRRPTLLERVRRETERLRQESAAGRGPGVAGAAGAGAAGAAGAGSSRAGSAAAGTATRAGSPPGSPAIPAPGTYPPPAGGSGLPPMTRPKWRVWGERAAAGGRQAATDAPERLRSWGRQAAEKGRALGAQGQNPPPGQPTPAAGRPVTGRGAPAPAAFTGRGDPAPAGTGTRLRPWKRKPAPETAAPRIPVQSRPPARPWAPTPPRPRRRLRRLRRLVLVVAVVVALFTVGPYLQPHIPVLNQYPVTAALPTDFSDLSLRDTAAGQRAAEKLAEQLSGVGAAADTFAGIYADGRGKRVTVFGVTGLRLTPGSDVAAQLSRLSGTLNLTDIRDFDTGVFGVHQQCGTGRLDGTSVVACTWADHGSLATVLLTRRNMDESADLVTRLRSTVLTTSGGTPLV